MRIKEITTNQQQTPHETNKKELHRIKEITTIGHKQKTVTGTQIKKNPPTTHATLQIEQNNKNASFISHT